MVNKTEKVNEIAIVKMCAVTYYSSANQYNNDNNK